MMLTVLVRGAVWLTAFFVYASLEKPAGSTFADLRPGAPGWIGLALIATGAALGLWSMLWLDRVLREPSAPLPPLVTGGPYGYVRNPLYAAAGVVCVGIVTVYAPWSGATAGRGILVALLVHAAVVRLEEPRTLRNLGPVYEDYCRRVPRWIPGLKPSRPGSW
jgi:protein-S-isoprenylcysteine O-methyltransferase Ste14